MKQIIYEVNLLVCVTVVSALPVSPLSFSQSGQIISTLCIFIQGIISYQSEKVYLRYMTNKKYSMDIVVGRQLGRQWGQCYLIISIIYFLQLTLLYSFYALTLFSQIVFYYINTILQTSIQYSYYMPISTLVISPVLFLIIIKRKNKQVTIPFFISSLSIIIYVIFLIVTIISFNKIDNPDSYLNNGSILQFFYLLSSNNLAYVNQLEIHQILSFKNNKITKQSKRSIKYSTYVVCLIYILIGNLGSYSIQGRQITGKNNSLIFDYFSDNVFTIITKLFVVYHFLQNLSYKYILLRKLLVKLILNSRNISDVQNLKKKMKFSLNLTFATFYVFINMTENDLQYKFTIITGSIAGYFILYLVPYKLQFRSLELAQKILMRSQNNLDPFIFTSMQNAQEIDNELLESQINLLEFRRKKQKKAKNRIITKQSQFFDKIKLLFGFFISVYGIFSFIYYMID